MSTDPKPSSPWRDAAADHAAPVSPWRAAPPGRPYRMRWWKLAALAAGSLAVGSRDVGCLLDSPSRASVPHRPLGGLRQRTRGAAKPLGEIGFPRSRGTHPSRRLARHPIPTQRYKGSRKADAIGTYRRARPTAASASSLS